MRMTSTVEHNREALCRQIEDSRIDDEMPSTMGPKHTHSWVHLGRRRHTYSVDKPIPENSAADPSADRSFVLSYVPLKDSPSGSPQLQRTRKRSATQYGRSHSVDLTGADRVSDLTKSEDHTDAGRMKDNLGLVIMAGWLHKTSRPKNSKTRGHSRQRRKFRLTTHSLEYSHQLQKVKIEKQYPLTSIINIVYDENDNPIVFKLEFQKIEVILEAHDPTKCKQWVEAIKKAWKPWNITNTQSSAADKDDDIAKDATKPEDREYLTKNKGYLKAAKKNLECITPGLVTSPDVAEKCFASEMQKDKVKSPIISGRSDSVTLPKHTGLQRFQARIGLAPRVQKSIDQWKSFSHEVEGDDKTAYSLLSKCSFVMIKYPRKRKGQSLPHERVFKMDFENLLIMWHQTEDSKFSYLRTLMTEHIVDVRKGQNSDGFDRYPYDELEDQSLSVLFEGEKQTVPGGKYYAVLQSLDLVCDSPEEQKLWHRVLEQFISPKFHLYSSRYDSTDPTIMYPLLLVAMPCCMIITINSLTTVGWLVTHWSILTNKGEIKEDAALSFGSSLVPHIKHNEMEQLLTRAHQCQLKESDHHGHSLHWDGFIFFFNLLCGIDESSCILLTIFQKYTEKYPSLGMTVEEFQKFLIEYQHWSPEDATNEKCSQLMLRYDYHYRAYKMHKANSTPFEFHLSLCMLSFGGFLSFLRSPDNSVIIKEHEDIYQDMTQPLSHYFINSSHNTYLEGHQLTGRSTTDAYVRALLQGCRCLELDCWDGADGEPRITHGNTLVSDLSLKEVTETINEYAFYVSNYPLILSLENHCNPQQQARMAEIFMEIFGEKLVAKKTSLGFLKVNDLDRLPSPQDLQGKIILKGTDLEPSSIESPKKLARTLFKKKSSRFPKPSTPKSKQRKDSQVNSLAGTIQSNVFRFPNTYQPQSNEENGSALKDGKSQEEDDDIEENDLSENLSDLIVYCRTKRIKPWSWDAQKTTSVCNMFSFNDSKSSTLINKGEDSDNMLACTERQFVRTYPHGTKIDSSNYDPIPLWNHGIQMVALNVQTPDNFMFLNQGKFRQNGGCGYVLKPKVMRNPTGTEYTPYTDEPLKEITPVSLTITPLSGQHFIVPSKKTVTMEIQYETYGIPHDCEKKKLIVNSNKTNPLWPQFQDRASLEKTIYMPELCLVLFAVNIRFSRKLQAGTKLKMLGQNVFPLESLKPGLRFIPLRTPGGESASHIGIFVEIRMNKLSHKQASSSGICPVKSMRRFSSPRMLDTNKLSLDETVEDIRVVEEHISHTEEENFATENSTDLLCSQPRMVRQEAVTQCITAEIHVNPHTDE